MKLDDYRVITLVLGMFIFSIPYAFAIYEYNSFRSFWDSQWPLPYSLFYFSTLVLSVLFFLGHRKRRLGDRLTRAATNVRKKKQLSQYQQFYGDIWSGFFDSGDEAIVGLDASTSIDLMLVDPKRPPAILHEILGSVPNLTD
ncbi:hypothetical protein [Parvularcula sp. IMCC14364]|uniref:hypothetical protein n=1 Tax=Parvularcula sp. IMCC14364 TaxID=3067902 RepID=UPI0027408A14|nr:hypothetical protein [Parvularcula sp. IMCC14364]